MIFNWWIGVKYAPGGQCKYIKIYNFKIFMLHIIDLSFFPSIFLWNAELISSFGNVQLLFTQLIWSKSSTIPMVDALSDAISNGKYQIKICNISTLDLT